MRLVCRVERNTEETELGRNTMDPIKSVFPFERKKDAAAPVNLK